ncbi:prepilin-type N-terminal cleavage/methylation domain-containing protein [Desulfocapsa sp. AH-315-G09]|uniref:Prepilin-type N-terminal cleavage/methylation domain-containing protein n=1 Tax=Desulfotalea psychrophila TaxID=84980 RepID=A0ABS3AUC9_9BACT|nr:prepilin-type N-terminal cleavage/methylation domain-containing protein [Desulfocapsa sp.]MBN4065428.1 prepilin-type N-terminal cleavage/methylation domain-containing protein [Desulfocapsa sp. AH-315-G09]MBN4068706.1 prepilin-type N-terminal cleavage/methylation domain-containing protein [Desulfotalea psychrophila]
MRVRLYCRAKEGFSLVEILIGVVVLSIAIMTLAAALRQAFQWQFRQGMYEEILITGSSIINEIVSDQIEKDVEQSQTEGGTLNGFSYTWTCNPFLADNNYEFSQDNPLNSGNTGFFRVVLQHCTLNISKNRMSREFEFYRTQYCCPINVNDVP